MAKVLAVCISPEKGTQKRNVQRAEFVSDYGIKGDAHAGPGTRQVSLISHQKIEDFRSRGAKVDDGAFGENLVVDGIDFRSLPVGTFLSCNDVILEITQIGKECHSRCKIYDAMGDCIMPREGVFARVIKGGFIAVGDEMSVTTTDKAAIGDIAAGASATNRVWIITSSDKGFKGEREDLSGPLIRELANAAAYVVVGYTLLPDEQLELESEMRRICDEGLAELILTTGGTGFANRDCMPEATLAVAQRLVPGIAEAMRSQSKTKRSMLSRAISAIRKNTLIINLPGSPKAVQESLELILPELSHGLDILCGRDVECGKK